jgi:hypothetical protein
METGTNTAATSRYPVASHCTVATSTPKVPMIGVRATLRKVSLKVARNAAAAATAIMPIAARGDTAARAEGEGTGELLRVGDG